MSKERTFTFDLCAGKTDAEIRGRYRKLVRAVCALQDIILMLVHISPSSVAKLPAIQRMKVQNLIDAYKD